MKILVPIVTVVAVGVASLQPLTCRADDILGGACSKVPGATGCSDETKDGSKMSETIKTIINTALFIAGTLAVVMIIYGGIRYVTSAGDKSMVAKAKSIVTYSVVGLIVAIASYAIVNFVLNRF